MNAICGGHKMPRGKGCIKVHGGVINSFKNLLFKPQTNKFAQKFSGTVSSKT